MCRDKKQKVDVVGDRPEALHEERYPLIDAMNVVGWIEWKSEEHAQCPGKTLAGRGSARVSSFHCQHAVQPVNPPRIGAPTAARSVVRRPFQKAYLMVDAVPRQSLRSKSKKRQAEGTAARSHPKMRAIEPGNVAGWASRGARHLVEALDIMGHGHASADRSRVLVWALILTSVFTARPSAAGCRA